MDPGPSIGDTASLTVTVTDELTARFDDEAVHAVYGTAALVRHMEQVSRRLLVPHLQPGEEGVGVEIRARHHRAAPVGSVVELTATVTEVTQRRLVTAVVAHVDGRIVADGSFIQAVVDLATWRRRAGIDP
jgi:fluoroacetyl-CoA thioesterase